MNQIESTISELSIDRLKMMQKSTKEYFIFDINVFNTGSHINVVCTDRFRIPSQYKNWNGYDFIVGNDDIVQGYVRKYLTLKTK